MEACNSRLRSVACDGRGSLPKESGIPARSIDPADRSASRAHALDHQLSRRAFFGSAVIRSIESKNVNHDDSSLYPSKNVVAGRQMPSIGSMLARVLADPASSVPYHVMFSNYLGASYYREHQVVDIVLRATRPADFHGSPRRKFPCRRTGAPYGSPRRKFPCRRTGAPYGSPRRKPRGELTMCIKAASRHSKTLGMDAVLPNHPALGATLTPLSACAF